MPGAVRLAGSAHSRAVRSANRLEFRSVTKGYERRGGTQIVLSAIDLTVAPGEFVALTGATGSGKTTLLELAAGLQRPTSGSVLVCTDVNGSAASASVDLASLSEARLAHWRLTKVGLLFRSQTLVDTLTAAENVALPLLLAGTSRTHAARRTAHLLDRLGLTELADDLPGELSQGQRYRLGVARALVNSPQLLLADEPTAGLDSVGVDEIMRLLAQLVESDGLTVLLATHDARAAAYATHAYRLVRGRLESA